MLVRLATVEDAGPLAAAMAEVAAEGDWLATEAPVDEADAALRFHTAAVSPAHSLWALEQDGWRPAQPATEAPVDEADAALRFHTAAVSPAHSLWALEQDGRVAGCAGLHPTAAEGVAALSMLVVAAARGRGGGRALAGAALARARAGDLHKVELEVWTTNARAIAFYARAGFTVEGLRRDHYRRGDGALRSTLVMALAV